MFYLKITPIRFLFLSIIIFLVGYLIFNNSLQGKFIWDDEAQIISNPYIHSLNNIPTFFSGGTFYLKNTDQGLQGIYYRPLMTVSYTILYHFFGLNPFFFHAFQLIIHITNAILLFALLLRLIKWKNILFPFLLSILFLIHPMNSETVSYIANLQDVLLFFFGILSLHIIMIKDHHIAKFVSNIILLFLSLLSKETAVVFVGILLCYTYLFQKKIFKLYLLAYSLLIIIYVIFRCGLAHICASAHKPNPIGELPFFNYLAQLPALIFYYLKTFVAPTTLAIGQSWVIKDISFSNFYFPILVVLILAGYLIFVLFKLYIQNNIYKKLYVFLIVWFSTGLIFHLHITPLDFTVTDRWFYVPMAGLIGLIGLLINMYSTNKKNIFIIISILSIWILVFCMITFKRNFDWHDNYTLFSRDVNKIPNSFQLENNLGVELYRKKHYDEAQIHFENAVRSAPNWHTALTNLAITYHRKKQYRKAEEIYKKAIKHGALYQAYQNYIALLQQQNRNDEALEFIERVALKKFPKNANLKKVYLKIKSHQNQ